MNKEAAFYMLILVAIFIYVMEEATANTSVVSVVVDAGNQQPSKLDPILDKITRR